MDPYLENLFREFVDAARAAQESGDRYIVIDRIYEEVDVFSAFPFPDVLGQIVTLVEAFPEIDYGSPGPLGGFVEEHPASAYAPALIESLRRQPSTMFVGLLSRLMMDNDFQDGRSPPSLALAREVGKCFESIALNRDASDSCKDLAASCLQDLQDRERF